MTPLRASGRVFHGLPERSFKDPEGGGGKPEGGVCHEAISDNSLGKPDQWDTGCPCDSGLW
jgi:hypothetical protein